MEIITCDCGQGPHRCGVTPDGTATVTISFEYPIVLANYPNNVTTVAQAVEFDAGEMAGDPQDWLMVGLDIEGEYQNLNIEARVKE